MADETEQAAQECTEESTKHSGFDRLLVVANRTLFRAQTTKHKNNIARYQAKADWFAMMKSRYQVRRLASLALGPARPAGAKMMGKD